MSNPVPSVTRAAGPQESSAWHGSTPASSPGVVVLPSLRIDQLSRRVFAGGQEVALTLQQFDLLVTLAEKHSRVWTYEQLSEAVWRQPYLGDTDHICAAVRRLRQRVASANRLRIRSVRSIGYCLDVLMTDQRNNEKVAS